MQVCSLYPAALLALLLLYLLYCCLLALLLPCLLYCCFTCFASRRVQILTQKMQELVRNIRNTRKEYTVCSRMLTHADVR